jgi:hypothetical protein
VAREDVVLYIKRFRKEFPLEELRDQLAEEGVGEAEFEEALKIATSGGNSGKKNIFRILSGALLAIGALCLLAALASFLLRKDSPPPAAKTSAVLGDSAFVGRAGYIVKLPEGYTPRQSFGDSGQTVEIVHFYKSGLDPTSLIDEALYGQLGIVRLTVEPSPFAAGFTSIDPLTKAVTSQARKHGQKFVLKPLQFSSLRGIQLNYDAPNPHVEAYILGRSLLYSLYAGQDDEIYRGLLNSLRDPQSEN